MMKTIMAVANAHTAFHYTPAARIVTTAATHLRTAATVTLRQVLTADATSASDMLLSARNVQSYSSGSGGGAAVVAAATMIVTSARKARRKYCTALASSTFSSTTSQTTAEGAGADGEPAPQPPLRAAGLQNEVDADLVSRRYDKVVRKEGQLWPHYYVCCTQLRLEEWWRRRRR